MNTLAKELENSDVYNRECNIDDAWVIIDKFSKKLTVLENEAQVFNYSTNSGEKSILRNKTFTGNLKQIFISRKSVEVLDKETIIKSLC